MLILMAGLPGTGKSTLSRGLAPKLGGTVIDKDQVRAALFSPPDIEYSIEQDDFCMAVMLKVAGYLFRKDPSRIVFLDDNILNVDQASEIGLVARRVHGPGEAREALLELGVITNRY